MQSIIIILIFLLAVGYLVRLVYRHFQSDQGCAKGCGACSTVDLEKIKDQMQEKSASS